MKEATKVTGFRAIECRATGLWDFSRGIFALPRSSGAPSLRWQETAPEHIQIGQREGGVQPSGVLRQPAVPHFVKAPHPLDNVEDMFDAAPSSGAATVDEPLVLTQVTGTAVDSVADTFRQG